MVSRTGSPTTSEAVGLLASAVNAQGIAVSDDRDPTAFRQVWNVNRLAVEQLRQRSTCITPACSNMASMASEGSAVRLTVCPRGRDWEPASDPHRDDGLRAPTLPYPCGLYARIADLEIEQDQRGRVVVLPVLQQIVGDIDPVPAGRSRDPESALVGLSLNKGGAQCRTGEEPDPAARHRGEPAGVELNARVRVDDTQRVGPNDAQSGFSRACWISRCCKRRPCAPASAKPALTTTAPPGLPALGDCVQNLLGGQRNDR